MSNINNPHNSDIFKVQTHKDCRDIADKAVNENKCVICGQPFTNENVYSKAGWAETKITGMCERCFDAAFKEEE